MLHKASFGMWLIGLVLLLILFLYDLQWYVLPNKVVYPLWLVSGASFLVTLWQKPTLHTILLGIAAVAVGAGVFWVLFEFSKGKWIGFGDVRLGVAIGLFVGTPLMAALVIFLSSVIGVLAALPGIVTGKKTLQSKLPYGPLLIIALVVVKLFGQRTIDWYAVHLLYI
jgi:prepilin signal peptidase PulO-like enzyme (type II secretory pathway)